MRFSKIAHCFFLVGSVFVACAPSAKADSIFNHRFDQTHVENFTTAFHICPPTAALIDNASGYLSPPDLHFDDNIPYDEWTFTLTSRRQVVINMTSESVDTFLILFDSSGRRLAENDDSGNAPGNGRNANSQIEIILQPGNYSIAATSVRNNPSLFINPPDIYGAYRLSVHSMCPLFSNFSR